MRLMLRKRAERNYNMIPTKYAKVWALFLLTVFPHFCLDATDADEEYQNSHLFVWGPWSLHDHKWRTPFDRVDVPTTVDVHLQQVSTRSHHILALDHEGRIHVWGPDDNGLVSEAPEGLFIKIAGNNMAIDTDGNVHVWGGFADNEWAWPPQGEFVEVARGSNYYAIDVNGNLHAWGRGVHPSALDVPEGKFRVISAYGDRAAAIDVAGRVHEWGHQPKQMKPAKPWSAEVDDYIPPPDGIFKAIAVGQMHSVAIDEEGRLHSWGIQHHELSNLYDVPDGEFISVTAGTHFSAAVDVEGRLHVWGSGPESPWTRFAPKARVVAIAAGSRHAAAILDSRDAAAVSPQPPRGRVIVRRFDDLDRISVDLDGQEYVVRLANVLPFSHFLEPLASLEFDDNDKVILGDLRWSDSDGERELQDKPPSVRGCNSIHLNILLVEKGLAPYVADVKDKAKRRRLLENAPKGELAHLAELQTRFKRPHEVGVLMAFEAADDLAREEQHGIWAFPELGRRLQDIADDMDICIGSE